MRWLLLLEDDVALGQHHLVGEHQAGHAVGLEFHHGLELLARHALVIAGVVVRGEGVFLAADARRRLREPAGRILRGALEHQVFEEMREAGFARRLVGGADLVPDHVGDDRRAVVGNDDQLEPVRQREVGDLGAGRLGGERRVAASAATSGRGGGEAGTLCEVTCRSLASCVDAHQVVTPPQQTHIGSTMRRGSLGAFARRACLSDQSASAGCRFAEPVGLVRRRRLISGRRCGQRGARRLPGEFGGLVLCCRTALLKRPLV